MTEQEKKILFQAICESLSYGLKCTTKAQGWPGVYPICGCIGNKIILDCPKEVEGDDIWLVQNIIPYLRPVNTMTEEEKEQTRDLWIDADIKTHETRLIDFYNKHHLDYQGLIPMGLALEAPEEMYK